MSGRTMVIITYCLANLLWENAVSLQTKANTNTHTHTYQFFKTEYCFFFPEMLHTLSWSLGFPFCAITTHPSTHTCMHKLYLHFVGIKAASLSPTTITIKLLIELLSCDRWKGCHDGVKTKNTPIRHRPRYVTTNNMAATESSVLQLIKMLPATKPKTKSDFGQTAILVKQFPEKIQSENAH